MYRLINQNAGAVVEAVAKIGDLSDYLTLRAALASSADIVKDSEFQRSYRRYWRMNAARLSDMFYSGYFTALAQSRRTGLGDLSAITRMISDPDGLDHGLQFSFATKLMHMVNPRLPVYDSFVAGFYFYVAPTAEKPFEERLSKYMEFYRFLEHEYARVLDRGLLAPAIEHFRNTWRIGPVVPDERLIDWLLWAWVSLLRNGAHARGQALYD